MHYSFFIAALLSTVANAHMTIVKPIPFRSPLNIYNVGPPDYSMSSPLKSDGSDFPCKGYHLLGMPADAPVETWEAGSVQIFTMSDSGATHGGGSCQASISEDNGVTFRAIKSYIGNCPVISASYNFTVPSETKAGNVLFAWTWFNQIGNREMYMNCAAITINGTGGAGLSTFPEIFKANIGSQSPGCATEESVDVVFPNPGPEVTIAPGTPTKTAAAGCISASAAVPPPGTPQGTSSSISDATTMLVSTSVTSSDAASSTVPAGSGTVNSTPTASPTPIEGCMCSCGGPNGYLVNIMPAGDVFDMLNSTDTTATTGPTAAVRFR